MPGPLLLVDTASMYFRSYYALPESMTAPDGRPNNAIRGFMQTLTRLVLMHGPDQVACCWDEDWRPQWRVDLLPAYKTHRVAVDGEEAEGLEEVPDTLSPQAEAIATILDAIGVARPAVAPYEADDCIATLARRADGAVVAVSGDRDMVQVVRDDVRLHLAVNGGMERWPLLDPDAVVERFGVSPEQYVDLAVLRGDPSDGIPGVPGIGAKTAVRLLTEFGSIDTALDAIDAATAPKWVTPRLSSALVEHRTLIHAMRAVATARTDVPWSGPTTIPTSVADPGRLDEACGRWGATRVVSSLLEAMGLSQR